MKSIVALVALLFVQVGVIPCPALAQSDADMLLVNLEDLWLESEPQNTPGTSHERPNWRRRLKYSLDEMRADKSVSELLEMVEAARRKTEKVS